MKTLYTRDSTLGAYRVVWTTEGCAGTISAAYQTFDEAETAAERGAAERVGRIVEVVQVTGQYKAVPQVTKLLSNA